MKANTIIATALLLATSSAVMAAEPFSTRAPGQVTTYTIKQLSNDGKPLGEWKTRFERPSSSNSCVKWRTRQGGPYNEVCGGIVQVTADEATPITIQ